ncbi:MauE/DoxX family redox-associated membrane protein [Botrimarina hoheduenensis]|uniref:Methylamine utilisation protein MauE domain-containing protein n=1 Tax=Botrimarina hoheduenensis TaxID=2528000 RepID=A0A5C5W0J9_9BACT|nr:MauE/DoxX family redox-associated membrane protein [Botrimarina hoheduenensis]TWT43501.1 hypothetical protein Pla111_24520 [Botrimarina hoheduenensis]
MRQKFETNLRCQKCLATIGPLLDDESGVLDWSVDLDDPRKPLTVDLAEASAGSRVVDLLAGAGYEATPVDRASTESIEPPNEADSAFKLANYKPLLLVVAYVLGATGVAESIHGGFVWPRAMSYFMGFFFLGFAFFKLLDIPAFADSFSSYDIIAKRSRGYALAYPWIELGLGVLFVSGVLPLVANGVTAVIMAVGLVGIVQAVFRKQAIQCACLGTVFNLPMSTVTIVENSVMLAMAITMLARAVGA